MRVPAQNESRILCNYDGSLDEVLTLAHELGHAYHNECLRGKTALQRRTPMTLAETASIFNQTIVTDAALARADSPAEDWPSWRPSWPTPARWWWTSLPVTSLRARSFSGGPGPRLAAEELCEIMLQAQRDTYGDGLDGNYLNPYMWAWKPHYYSSTLSFYNFPYAFGLLFGLGLYAIYEQRGEAFLADYDALLASTGDARAEDLAARFGIELRSPAFWESSLEIVARRVDRYVAL